MTTYIARRLVAEPVIRRIDYDRMNREWPKQKAALTRAKKTGDARKVAEVCVEAARVWDEIGAWPDDWRIFESTLNDMLHWRTQIDLQELVRGRYVIEALDD